jgi:hypothetical protein
LADLDDGPQPLLTRGKLALRIAAPVVKDVIEKRP